MIISLFPLPFRLSWYWRLLFCKLCPAEFSRLLLSDYYHGCEAASLRKTGSSPRIQYFLLTFRNGCTPDSRQTHRMYRISDMENCILVLFHQCIENVIQLWSRIHAKQIFIIMFCFVLFLLLICDVPFPPLSRTNNFIVNLLKTGQNVVNIFAIFFVVAVSLKGLFKIPFSTHHNATHNVVCYGWVQSCTCLSVCLYFLGAQSEF